MENEEINLNELLGFFIKKLWLIGIIVIAVLVVGLSYSIFIKKPLYNSDVSLILVNKKAGETASALQSDILVNQKLAATYREIVKSRLILKQVIENLDLDYSVGQLSSMITVSSIENTEMLKISVNSPNAKESQTIANETSKIFKKEIAEIYNLENVSIIDSAEIAENPFNTNITKDILIYLALGLVASCGLVFMIYYFDNTVKSVEQIENCLGIPVIGTVPMVKTKGE